MVFTNKLSFLVTIADKCNVPRLRPILTNPLSIALIALFAASPVLAQGTTTYEYDALGRLVGATTSGGANDGLGTVYEYDAAGNRKRVEVTGSDGSPGGPSRFIVLPINGFLVIPIRGSSY